MHVDGVSTELYPARFAGRICNIIRVLINIKYIITGVLSKDHIFLSLVSVHLYHFFSKQIFTYITHVRSIMISSLTIIYVYILYINDVVVLQPYIIIGSRLN